MTVKYPFQQPLKKDFFNLTDTLLIISFIYSYKLHLMSACILSYSIPFTIIYNGYL